MTRRDCLPAHEFVEMQLLLARPLGGHLLLLCQSTTSERVWERNRRTSLDPTRPLKGRRTDCSAPSITARLAVSASCSIGPLDWRDGPLRSVRLRRKTHAAIRRATLTTSACRTRDGRRWRQERSKKKLRESAPFFRTTRLAYAATPPVERHQ